MYKYINIYIYYLLYMNLIYSYDDFKNCKIDDNINPLITKFLITKPYKPKPNKDYLTTFDGLIRDIISSKLSSMNFDDYRNTKLIKTYVNSLSSSSYQTNINLLNELSYNEKITNYLFETLLLCAIKSQISIKCKIFNNDKLNTNLLPILCCYIYKDINITNKKELYEQIIFSKLEKLLLLNFNKDNEDTIDLYRGLLTFIGIMYINDLVNDDYIMLCFDFIYNKMKSIENINDEQYMFSNLYYGFENLLKCMINKNSKNNLILLFYNKILEHVKIDSLRIILNHQMYVLQNK